MGDKHNVNIDVNVNKADQAKRNLNQVSNEVDQFGDRTEKAGKKGAKGLDQASKKAGGFSSILKGATVALGLFAAAGVGLSTLVSALQDVYDKLFGIQRLQKEMHEENLPLLNVGQALENQTGTVGKQQEWADFAAHVQTAGGLESASDAAQMAIAMDVAMSNKGGIKNEDVQSLVTKLAPMFGTQQMSGDEIAKFFDFAGTMKAEQTEDGYRKAFAQMMAGYRSAKTTTGFGSYVTGLQSGVTGYVAQGGSPEFGISLYTAAREVMANEAVAATLTEQTTRLSTGAYQKPREALEKFSGQKWSNISTDQRTAILAAYVHSLPEGERMERLTAEGFPAELAGGIAKLVTASGQQKFGSTYEAVSNANPGNIVAQTEAYKDSILGQDRQAEGERLQGILGAAKEFSKWQLRIKKKQDEFEVLRTLGKDRFFVKDEYEPHLMAYEDMLQEIDSLSESLEGVDTEESKKLQSKLYWFRKRTGQQAYNLGRASNSYVPEKFSISQAMSIRRGSGFEDSLEEFSEQGQTIINNNYHHDMNMFPVTSTKGVGRPRYDPYDRP